MILFLHFLVGLLTITALVYVALWVQSLHATLVSLRIFKRPEPKKLQTYREG